MIKCNICNEDNLPPDHFISILHMQKQVEYEREKIKELDKDA
jgi:hypothetical protein